MALVVVTVVLAWGKAAATPMGLMAVDPMLQQRSVVDHGASSALGAMSAIAPISDRRDLDVAEIQLPGSRWAQPQVEASTDGQSERARSVREQPMFDGRPIRPAHRVTMIVTAYSPDERSCGKFADGMTASGYSVWTNGMKLAAADTRLLPFKTLVSVPGYNGGRPVPVLDRGGKIKGRCLDLLYPTHEAARQWGRQELEVTVWEYADR